jgi:hypothetical protein
MVLQTSNGPAPKTFILVRGDYNNPRDEVSPGYPAILTASASASTPLPSPGVRSNSPPRSTVTMDGATTPPNRGALADWLTQPEQPLTARVLVNRVWQHHFGRGLVATPSDFGTRGALPSHPALLDWLAGEFVRNGWRLKSLHRLILTSAAYQQSAGAPSETRARDPENRWFSRQNRTRLEGEVIRDSLLAISGRLNPAQYGPGVSPPIPADITRTSKNWTSDADLTAHTRRSVYIFARRNLRFPFLEAFDSPDSNLSCPERGRSTTAPQSLTLLNSDDVMEAAQSTAQRIQTQTNDPKEQIRLAYRMILARPPSPQELSLSREFMSESARRPAAAGLSSRDATRTSRAEPLVPPPLRELCRALFNLNAFVYVD